MSTYNLYFFLCEKYQFFLSENFQFWVVKFSIYLNRHAFVMIADISMVVVQESMLHYVYEYCQSTLFKCVNQNTL